MKKAGLLLALSIMLIAGCKKDDGTNSTYDTQIKGVQLRAVDASDAGTLGSPDTKTDGQGWFSVAYPIPCSDVLSFFIRTTPSSGLSAKCRLVSALFTGAPPTASIQNQNMVGVVVKEIATETLTGENHFTIDVSDVPQGFYRLYFELSDGQMYWDNIWIAR
jgi:hypothetical protein